MSERDIYSPAYLRALFDEMAGTYGVVNLISSFGFTRRWRRQCVEAGNLTPESDVLDLMSGMGETWPIIIGKIGERGTIAAVDISPVMVEKSRHSSTFTTHQRIRILEEDVLNNSIESDSADFIISTFGLKTFSGPQLNQLAGEIRRILRPGGNFSLLEISVPPRRLLQSPYLFYLNNLIPLIGRVFLGNPDNYRMLGVYTQRFGDCGAMQKALQSQGLKVEYQRYFFGCATGVVGRKLPE
ncbi:MAG: class I SAM-dependent methyltransferase [Anaerolineales bacterium]|nr:class I SAM-dependent methyltransferase [Anaerolineales bacterium]